MKRYKTSGAELIMGTGRLVAPKTLRGTRLSLLECAPAVRTTGPAEKCVADVLTPAYNDCGAMTARARGVAACSKRPRSAPRGRRSRTRAAPQAAGRGANPAS